jgi:hypothetical protein
MLRIFNFYLIKPIVIIFGNIKCLINNQPLINCIRMYSNSLLIHAAKAGMETAKSRSLIREYHFIMFYKL